MQLSGGEIGVDEGAFAGVQIESFLEGSPVEGKESEEKVDPKLCWPANHGGASSFASVQPEITLTISDEQYVAP